MKNQITQGKWKILEIKADLIGIYSPKNSQVIAQFPLLGSLDRPANTMDQEFIANATAICKAVNNTYGLGIDPENIEEGLKLIEATLNSLIPDKESEIALNLKHALTLIKLEDK